MTDKDESEMFERTDGEGESETSIFSKAVETGEMSTLNEAAEHIDSFHSKRAQAVELGLPAAKEAMDDRLEQAKTDLEAMAETAADRNAEYRARSLAGLADGANVDLEKFANDGDTGGMNPTRMADTSDRRNDGSETTTITDNLSREQKIEFTRESIQESREMGLHGAEEHYRARLDDLLRGRAE